MELIGRDKYDFNVYVYVEEARKLVVILIWLSVMLVQVFGSSDLHMKM